MQRLRIGLFAPYDLARAGGVNTHLRAQARALRARGHDVTIYGPASAPLANGEIALGRSLSLTLGGTESGLGLDHRSLPRVKALFTTETFDVVHVHEPLVPLLPWLVLRGADRPIVATFHVHREDGHRWYPLARSWLRKLVDRIDVRIAVSEAARHTVAAHFPGEYEIVPNAIDVDAFRAPQPRPPVMRPVNPMDNAALHVLYVGRLEPRKGVDHLIRAMPEVQRRVPHARLVVVGDGPDHDALSRVAASVGAEVEFAGSVSDDDLPAFFQASDVVCSPATGGESFGIVLLEAMACGKPIVASRIAGYEALIGRVACGRLVPPGDAPAIAEALVSLLRDGELRHTLGARGLREARKYDWPETATRLETIYQRLVESRLAAAEV